jgi:hypothetical protein
MKRITIGAASFVCGFLIAAATFGPNIDLAGRLFLGMVAIIPAAVAFLTMRELHERN